MKKRKSKIVTKFKIATILLLLCFFTQAVSASDYLKIVPDFIDFGFVPFDEEIIKEFTLENITGLQIENVSIIITDSIAAYFHTENVGTSIDPHDSTKVHLSFSCSEMFVTREGKIFIKYKIEGEDFEDEIRVHGEPALKRGWNWISFPKLCKRSDQGTEISAILKPLEPFARIVLCKGGVMESIENSWAHMGLFHYDDTAFIKLRMLGGNEYVYPFELKGDSLSLLPAATAFDLNKGYNWIGYWLQEPQDVRTAFGAAWDKVHAVKAESWFYINQKFITENYSIILDLPANQDRLLHYGRGYVVIMKETEKGFSWIRHKDERNQEQPCNNTTYFMYEKRANYEVIDVINIPDNATEVGAFTDDGKCIGAGFVNEHHAAQLLIYPYDIPEDGTELSFRIKYHDQLNPRPITYLLFNNSTRKFVDTKLCVNKKVYNIIKICDE